MTKRDLPNPGFPLYYLTFIPGIHKRNTTENNHIINEIMPTDAVMVAHRSGCRLRYLSVAAGK